MEETIFTVVSRILGVPRSEITEASSSDTIDRWDSLKHIRIVLSVEEELGIKFTERQIADLWDIASFLYTARSLNTRKS